MVFNLEDGLVLCLPFSEGTGSKVWDRSKQQNHGSIVGAVFVEPFESESDGAWIKADWNINTTKRMKITIDSSVVDADQTDFPVYLNISAASGIGNVDVSAIFDELGANSLKLAVATFSGIQCYVEVVNWDDVGEVAELHVKVPYVSSSVDTIIYLYYDVNHADNTGFVGVTNSAVAENVWGTNFKFVCHMDDNPDNANVRDSTTNDHDGAKFGANEPNEVAGKIVNAQDFDGGNDIITITAHADFNVTANQTIEGWIKLDALPAAGKTMLIIFKTACYGFRITDTGAIGYFVWGKSEANSPTTPISGGTWYHVMWTYDGTDHKIYVDGSLVLTNTVTETIPVAGNDLRFAHNGGIADHDFFAGLMDEMRISTTAVRTIEYAKATYNAGNDSLVTFSGVEETYSKSLPDWRFGDALAFDGANDYVTVTYPDVIELPFTLSAWIFDVGYTGACNIFDKSYNFQFQTMPTNHQLRLAYYAGGAWQYIITGNDVYTANTWHHLVLVVEASGTNTQAKFYVDGILVYVGTDTGHPTNTANITIGAFVGGAAELITGIIDECRIYKRALTPEEIRTLFERKVA